MVESPCPRRIVGRATSYRQETVGREMTIFKDRLAGTIRIKRKFAPSKERIKQARNNVIGVAIILLTLMVVLLVFDWLQS